MYFKHTNMTFPVVVNTTYQIAICVILTSFKPHECSAFKNKCLVSRVPLGLKKMISWFYPKNDCVQYLLTTKETEYFYIESPHLPISWLTTCTCVVHARCKSSVSFYGVYVAKIIEIWPGCIPHISTISWLGKKHANHDILVIILL